MKDIISVNCYRCGTEKFDFPKLYINSPYPKEQLPINVLLIEHKKFGHILINTGCSFALIKRPFDYLRYLKKHKIKFSGKDSIISHLNEKNMDSLCIKKVLLTHCNGECCGGLPLIKRYELLSTAQVLSVMQVESNPQDILKSTLPPAHIPMKAVTVYSGFSILQDYFKYVYDVLGDGSVLAVDISGNTQAMAGYFITEENLFFGADAAVDERVLDNDIEFSTRFLSSVYHSDDYVSVIDTLRKIHKEHPEIKFIFSHSKVSETE